MVVGRVVLKFFNVSPALRLFPIDLRTLALVLALYDKTVLRCWRNIETFFGEKRGLRERYKLRNVGSRKLESYVKVASNFRHFVYIHINGIIKLYVSIMQKLRCISRSSFVQKFCRNLLVLLRRTSSLVCDFFAGFVD